MDFMLHRAHKEETAGKREAPKGAKKRKSSESAASPAPEPAVGTRRSSRQLGIAPDKKPQIDLDEGKYIPITECYLSAAH